MDAKALSVDLINELTRAVSNTRGDLLRILYPDLAITIDNLAVTAGSLLEQAAHGAHGPWAELGLAHTCLTAYGVPEQEEGMAGRMPLAQRVNLLMEREGKWRERTVEVSETPGHTHKLCAGCAEAWAQDMATREQEEQTVNMLVDKLVNGEASQIGDAEYPGHVWGEAHRRLKALREERVRKPMPEHILARRVLEKLTSMVDGYVVGRSGVPLGPLQIHILEFLNYMQHLSNGSDLDWGLNTDAQSQSPSPSPSTTE